MCKSMFSLFCLDNLFLPLQKPVQEQRDTLEPKHLLISFVFAVAHMPRTAIQALHAVFGSLRYITLQTEYLLACRASQDASKCMYKNSKNSCTKAQMKILIFLNTIKCF